MAFYYYGIPLFELIIKVPAATAIINIAWKKNCYYFQKK